MTKMIPLTDEECSLLREVLTHSLGCAAFLVCEGTLTFNLIKKFEEAQKERAMGGARHTACRFCGLDIEGVSPYRKGEWRDRGNNSTCPSGDNEGKYHSPVRETS